MGEVTGCGLDFFRFAQLPPGRVLLMAEVNQHSQAIGAMDDGFAIQVRAISFPHLRVLPSLWVKKIELGFCQRERGSKWQTHRYPAYKRSEFCIIRQKVVHVRQSHHVLQVHEIVSAHLTLFAPTVVGCFCLYRERRKVCQLECIKKSAFAVLIDNHASGCLGRQ